MCTVWVRSQWSFPFRTAAPPNKAQSAPASSLGPFLHCCPCNSMLSLSRENSESEAQLITLLTCFRSLCAKPDWEKYLHIQRWKLRQGIRTHKERKKIKRQQNKTKLPFLPSGQSPNSWPWHLKPSETWPSLTSSASCPATLASHGWHSTKSQVRHCRFPPRAGAALLLLPTLQGGATSSRKPSDSPGLLNHPALSSVTVLIILCCL